MPSKSLINLANWIIFINLNNGATAPSFYFFVVVLTLQFGNLSNHIMTHYWNIQDEQLKIPDETVLRFESLYYENEKGRMPFTLFFDTKQAFGNYIGWFDAEKPDIEEVEGDIMRQWQGGYIVTEEDLIEKSEFARALDGIDEEIENEEKRKRLERDEEEKHKRILEDNEEMVDSTDKRMNHQNIFAQFLKESMQQVKANNEEMIDSSNNQKEVRFNFNFI